jgi:hypothetical protein
MRSHLLSSITNLLSLEINVCSAIERALRQKRFAGARKDADPPPLHTFLTHAPLKPREHFVRLADP